eukprot:TRINITY_DN30293_c0_g1_i1.p1 TRINITY_DN30293_c0_g1~~TRINITY_DN30293_c0_g1_i1.p1  ORF type:complete len:472 (+),score=104.72 TRINITY_DN30293_c0_g1_i1:54-1418(+)
MGSVAADRLAPVVEFFTVSGAGATLLQCCFREDKRVPGVDTAFYRRVARRAAPPVFLLRDLTVAWIERDGLYFVCYTRGNPSPSLLIELLAAVYSLVLAYVGSVPGKTRLLTEASLEANQPMLYELLQEVMDGGIPQSTDHRLLSLHLQNKADEATDIDSWVGRPLLAEGKQDEIYVDVVESVDARFLPDGAVEPSSVRALGEVRYKAFVSRSPRVTLSLGRVAGDGPVPSGAAVLRYSILDAAVDKEGWQRSRSLTFTAAPGAHTALRYVVTEAVALPFLVCVSCEADGPRTMRTTARVRFVAGTGTRALTAELLVPVPSGALKPSITHCKEGGCARVLDVVGPRDGERARGAAYRHVKWKLGPFGEDRSEQTLAVTCRRLPEEPCFASFAARAKLLFEVLDWPATPVRLGDHAQGDGTADCAVEQPEGPVRRFIRRMCTHGSFTADLRFKPD